MSTQPVSSAQGSKAKSTKDFSAVVDVTKYLADSLPDMLDSIDPSGKFYYCDPEYQLGLVKFHLAYISNNIDKASENASISQSSASKNDLESYLQEIFSLLNAEKDKDPSGLAEECMKDLASYLPGISKTDENSSALCSPEK